MSAYEIYRALLIAGLYHQIAKLEDNITKDKWIKVHDLAVYHAVIGTVWDGIEMLPEEQQPPKLLRMQWIAAVLKIEERNKHIEEAIVELKVLYEKSGVCPLLFKGSSVGIYYPSPLHRQCGDIDFVVRRNVINTAVLTNTVSGYAGYGVFLYKKIKVELHREAEYTRDVIVNRSLKKIFEKGEREARYIKINGCQIPVLNFTAEHIAMLLHIRRHIMESGMGMKQFCDIAVLLKNVDYDKKDLIKGLKRVHLLRFARVVYAYLESELGLDTRYLPLLPDKGQKYSVLKDCLEGGFAAKEDFEDRLFANRSVLVRMYWRIKRSAQFFSLMPGEAFWTPIFFIVRYIKKKIVVHII